MKGSKVVREALVKRQLPGLEVIEPANDALEFRSYMVEMTDPEAYPRTIIITMPRTNEQFDVWLAARTEVRARYPRK